MAEYRLTPAAERDLEGIWQYSTERWGSEQAGDYLDSLIEVFANLAKSPMSAPACDHIRAGYRRRRVRHHLVYFRLTIYGIAVIRVLHERMDAPSHL